MAWRASGDSLAKETYPVRLSSRISWTSYEKLVAYAKFQGWLNAAGKPNISRVINTIIDKFEFEAPVRKKRKKNGKK